MFATKNSQSVYRGVVDKSYSQSNLVTTGATDGISALNGTAANDGSHAFKALGIENIWGNVYKQILDLSIKTRVPYICENLDQWTNTDPASNAAFKKIDMMIPSSSSWITEIAQAEDHSDVVLPVAASGGSDSTYFADYVYADNGGPYTALYGGILSDGSNAGLFYFNLYNSLTNTNWNIGARLLSLENSHFARKDRPPREKYHRCKGALVRKPNARMVKEKNSIL